MQASGRSADSGPAVSLLPQNYTTKTDTLHNVRCCSVNALLNALIPTGVLTDASAPASALHRELLLTGQVRPRNAVASFALGTLTPRWRYDGQQQDSSEFLLALFRGISDMPITRPWAQRDLLTGEQQDGGGPPGLSY